MQIKTYDIMIEKLLRSYPVLVAIEEIQAGELKNAFAMYSNYDCSVVHDISDPTSVDALKSMTMEQRRKKIAFIEYAVNSMSKLCRDICQLYYFDQMKFYEVITRLNVSPRNFYRYKRDIIDRVYYLVI